MSLEATESLLRPSHVVVISFKPSVYGKFPDIIQLLNFSSTLIDKKFHREFLLFIDRGEVV